MSGAWDYLNSINGKKNNMMRDTDDDVAAEAAYQPYLTNRTLSYYAATILAANLMNVNPELEKRPQYEFLLNSTRRGKRFAKMTKFVADGDIDVICEHYKCNPRHAHMYRGLLSDSDMLELKRLVYKGGNSKPAG